MKKSSIFALGFALLAGSAVAQNAQEVTYVEDPSQGYLFNKFSSNWFLQAEGGVAVAGHTAHDGDRKFGDRFTPAAKLYIGKWFSPILGGRIGGEFTSVKGVAADRWMMGARPWEPMVDGKYYKDKVNYFGASFDVMLSLTNWWCGYKPNRVYNAYIYAGAGLYWAMDKQLKDGKVDEYSWQYANDKVIMMRAGLAQDFNITRHFALGLDLRATAMDNHVENNKGMTLIAEALISATFKFGNSEWHAPVVPVCPPAENCDEYRARLQAADARIADLESQLRDCLNRPVEKVEAEKAPLATVYYPIGVSRLTREDRNILGAISEVMKSNSKTNYVLTGWADNYTGSEQVNIRLRKARVDGVYKQLVKNGVPASQLTATTNNGSLCDLGEKYVALDRAVTIEEAE